VQDERPLLFGALILTLYVKAEIALTPRARLAKTLCTGPKSMCVTRRGLWLACSALRGRRRGLRWRPFFTSRARPSQWLIGRTEGSQGHANWTASEHERALNVRNYFRSGPFPETGLRAFKLPHLALKRQSASPSVS